MSDWLDEAWEECDLIEGDDVSEHARSVKGPAEDAAAGIGRGKSESEGKPGNTEGEPREDSGDSGRDTDDKGGPGGVSMEPPEKLIAVLQNDKALIRLYGSREEELLEQLGQRKRAYLREVQEAKTESRKPIFSNETARELAVKERTDNDQEYHAWKNELKNVQLAIQEAKDEIEVCEWKLKLHLARLSMFKNL